MEFKFKTKERDRGKVSTKPVSGLNPKEFAMTLRSSKREEDFHPMIVSLIFADIYENRLLVRGGIPALEYTPTGILLNQYFHTQGWQKQIKKLFFGGGGGIYM